MALQFIIVTPDKVNHLRAIALKTFVQSYQHLNTADNFQWYVSRAFSTEKLSNEILNKDSFVFFVKHKGEVIGYLKLNINNAQTEKHCLQCLEIERIYLDTIYQGKGFGRKMIQFAEQKAKAFNISKIWLGVWEKNLNAIQFYKRVGFEKAGSHIFKFGDEDQIDEILEKIVEEENS